MTRLDAAGIVLCGGRSTRMGRPKAWLPWRGRPLVAHMAALLGEALAEVVVVTSAELSLPPLDARVVKDREPWRGPLFGILEGLAAITRERAFVAGTDAPLVTRELIAALFAAGPGAVAVEQDGHVQSLGAVYPRTGIAAARAILAREQGGGARPLHLLEALGYRRLDGAALPGAAALRGFNSPEEYLDAVRRDDPQARVAIEFLGAARRAAGRTRAETAVGTLAAVLDAAAPGAPLLDAGRLARPYLAALGGRAFARDGGTPVGGEEVIVLDASVGG